MKLARFAVLAAAGVAIAAFAGVFQPSGAQSAATDTTSSFTAAPTPIARAWSCTMLAVVYWVIIGCADAEVPSFQHARTRLG